MNILVTGANGQLGSELNKLIQNKVFQFKDAHFIFTDIDILDISNISQLEEFNKKYTFKYIIN